MKQFIIGGAIKYPKLVFFTTLLLCLIALSFVPSISIDTDPENMLPDNHPARLLHDEVKKKFGLSDMLVVGVVNTKHPNGVYNIETLSKLYLLTKAALKIEGVINDDVMSLVTADNIRQGELGAINFDWMMPRQPDDNQQAALIQSWVERLPLMNDTLVSGDAKAAGIYIPIVAKDQSYRIYQELLEVTETFPHGDDEFHITGLPVAEDTFGVEMFKQMAISAPAAGLLIFILMLFFFRSAPLVAAPMMVAMATVIITVGLMIGLGFSVHIMSSMIPIFLMPIAVVDSVHILSEFNDHYRPNMNKKTLAREVVDGLFQPMLFTSITSMVGFASLNTASIPPVQVFGSFVALGIAVAFILSITLVPAYITCLSDKTLATMAARVHSGEKPNSLLARLLRKIPGFSHRSHLFIIIMSIALLLVSYVGINKIVIDDNPVNWFEEKHPIRIADTVLNKHFAGTYEAYLSFDQPKAKAVGGITATTIEEVNTILTGSPAVLVSQWEGVLDDSSGIMGESLKDAVLDYQMTAEDDHLVYWDKISDALNKAAFNNQTFLQPENLEYLERVEGALMSTGLVGKANGFVDLLKTVNRELRSGKLEDYQLPHSKEAVAQAVLAFQGSHRPLDVWHMVNPDYSSSLIWLQLKSGNNQDMSKILSFMDDWFANNPPPAGLKPSWSGLSYINVAWQDAMVSGMLQSLLSSFFIVAVMMMLLFRSISWGLIAMLPLTLTIAFIYGLIGLTGKNYDMPVAVLSALTLGMSIDFAIHFIERCRALVKELGSWQKALIEVFEEPGRAISRNAIVIALGFTPLLLAPLVPYQTVGVFLASIMLISCIATILLLPAVISIFQRFLFSQNKHEI